MCFNFAFLGIFSLYLCFFWCFFGVFVVFSGCCLLILFCRTVLHLSSISLHFFHQGMLSNFAFLGFFSLYFRVFCSFFVVFESSWLIFGCRIVLQLSSISLHFFHQGMQITFPFFGVSSLYFRFFWVFLGSFFGLLDCCLLTLFCRTVLHLPSISLHFFHQGMLINFAFFCVFSLYFGFFWGLFDCSVLILFCRTLC